MSAAFTTRRGAFCRGLVFTLLALGLPTLVETQPKWSVRPAEPAPV